MHTSQNSDSPSHDHKHIAAQQGIIQIALVTVSDTRTPSTDKNGAYLTEQIEAVGHVVTSKHIVKDDPQDILHVLEEIVNGSARMVIFNGGTGISSRDRTFDAIDKKLEKRLPGFGEIFRMLSYNDVGSAAMLSRACAGVYRDTVVLSIPGSPNAVKLAWEKLIAPELEHLAWEVLR